VTVPGMESYTKAMYYQYMQKIQELDGEARALYMVDERADIDSIIEQFAVIEKEYEMGKIPYEEYKSYLTTYYDAKERNNVFIRVENYVGYVERKNTQLGLEEKPIYTEGYEAYFADTADLFAGIALIILCVNVFTTEYRSQSSSAGCINIVRSTLRGRWQTFWTKTILFSLLGGVTAVLFRLVDWMVISQKYVFDYKEAALYCLGIFSKITTVISIEEYMVWDMAMRFFGGIILSLMICILSYAGKKILSVLSLTVLITAIPEILVLTVLKSKAELSPLTLLCPHRLLYAYSGNVYSQETAVAVWAAVLGCIALAAAIICGMRFAGKKWRIG